MQLLKAMAKQKKTNVFAPYEIRILYLNTKSIVDFTVVLIMYEKVQNK